MTEMSHMTHDFNHQNHAIEETVKAGYLWDKSLEKMQGRQGGDQGTALFLHKPFLFI